MTDPLLDFWPTLSNQREVLGTQAQAQKREIFLSVHQEMEFEVYQVGNPAPTTRGEDELLEALLGPPPTAGTVILPILGDSGVGKSHAVRWLSEKLREQHDPSLHAVWVPRGESLKQTLRRVLSAFEGSPQHAELETALDGANEMTPRQVRERLRTALVDQLRFPTQELKKRVGDDLFEFAEDYGERLGALLQDPASGWKFFEWEDYDPEGGRGSLTRLTRHVMEAFSPADDRGEVDRKFVDEDLNIPASLDGEDLRGQMGELAQTCAGELKLEDYRAPSLELLNHVLDAAKRESLDLGGVDLLSLFKRFRRELMAQGKDLVLLIEDFTVMAGLQGQLYDIMVQSQQADEEPICTLRTVFALTPGYMQGQDLPQNVRTRAGAEWQVSGGRDNEAILEHSIDLVGAYLNAARVGLSGLREQGTSYRLQPGEEFPTESRSQLEAFGKSANGHWLFPFNQAALTTMIRDKLPETGFNPRMLLLNVVSPVLDQRSQFESGRFPTQKSGRLASSPVSGEVSKLVAKPDLERALVTIGTWGGNPRSWDDVTSLPAGIFEAFSLPSLADIASGKIPTKTPPSGEAPDKKRHGGDEEPPAGPDDAPVPPTPTPRSYPELEDWREKGALLPQAMSAKLRKQAAGLVLSQVPTGWPGLPHYSVTHLASSVFIPNSRSGAASADAAFISLGTENDIQDTSTLIRLERELAALLRLDDSDGDLSHEGARDDVPIICALVRRLLPHALEWLRNHPLDRKSGLDPTEDLLTAHLLSSSLLGRESKATRGPRTAMLFPRVEHTSSGVEVWDSLMKTVEDAFDPSSQGSFTSGLASLRCAFQGTGNKPFAFDVAGVWDELLSADPERVNLFEAGTDFASRWRNIQQSLDEIRDFLKVNAGPARGFVAWTGNQPNGEVLGGVRNLATATQKAGRMLEQAERVLTEVSALASLDTQLSKNAERITQVDSAVPVDDLPELSKIDWKAFRLSLGFQSSVEELIQPLENDLTLDPEVRDETDAIAQANAILGGPLAELDALLRGTDP